MTEENQTDDSAPQEDSGTHTPETSPVEENPTESGDKAVEETPDLTGAEPQSEVSDEPKEEASVESKEESADESKEEASVEAKEETADEPKEKASEEQKEKVADKPKAKASDKPKAEESEKPTAKKKEEVGKKDSAKQKVTGKPEPKDETAADLLKAEVGNLKIRKAKRSKNIVAGIVHILATFNNTIVTFTDKQGNVISWSSSGKCNFRGSRKSTAYAAQIVTQDAGRMAMSHGLKEVEVRVKGPGMGRDSAVRALQTLGLIVTSIIDVTPVPHNGCRPPKRRRV